MSPQSGPLHAFLAGLGRDSRGRTLDDVLALDDARLEALHDYIQWLFPLSEASRAVPGSPVLGRGEAEAIRADSQARAGLARALDRMARFYEATGHWLVPFDHNHLRITRILAATRDLLSPDVAGDFHAGIVAKVRSAGSPVNRESLAYWSRVLGDDESRQTEEG